MKDTCDLSSSALRAALVFVISVRSFVIRKSWVYLIPLVAFVMFARYIRRFFLSLQGQDIFVSFKVHVVQQSASRRTAYTEYFFCSARRWCERVQVARCNFDGQRKRNVIEMMLYCSIAPIATNVD